MKCDQQNFSSILQKAPQSDYKSTLRSANSENIYIYVSHYTKKYAVFVLIIPVLFLLKITMHLSSNFPSEIRHEKFTYWLLFIRDKMFSKQVQGQSSITWNEMLSDHSSQLGLGFGENVQLRRTIAPFPPPVISGPLPDPWAV